MGLDNNNRYDANRQRQIDKAMCRPGHTWIEMPWKKSGGQCVSVGAYNDHIKKNGQKSQQSALPSSADSTISGEIQARQMEAPANQSTNSSMKAAQLQQLGKDLKKKSAAASQRTPLDLKR